MIIAITFICMALLFYTTEIWSERIVKYLKKWMVIVFSMGFVSDLIGTSIMFFRATEKFSLSVHAISGYSALGIMPLHLIWAFLAKTKSGKYEKYFTKFSIFAWMIWLIAFISGIPNG